MIFIVMSQQVMSNENNEFTLLKGYYIAREVMCRVLHHYNISMLCVMYSLLPQ